MFFKKFKGDYKNGIVKDPKLEKKKEEHPFFKIETEKDNKYFKMFKKKYLSKLINLKKEEKNDIMLKDKVLSMVCGKKKNQEDHFLEKYIKRIKKKKRIFKQKSKKNLLTQIWAQNIFK